MKTMIMKWFLEKGIIITGTVLGVIIALRQATTGGLFDLVWNIIMCFFAGCAGFLISLAISKSIKIYLKGNFIVGGLNRNTELYKADNINDIDSHYIGHGISLNLKDFLFSGIFLGALNTIFPISIIGFYILLINVLDFSNTIHWVINPWTTLFTYSIGMHFLIYLYQLLNRISHSTNGLA